MILVTGSTGTFGSHVAKELQKKKIPFKAAGQQADKINLQFSKDVSVVAFDWADPNSFTGLFDGVTAIYLVSPPNSNVFPAQIKPFLEKAKSAGVQFILLSTVLGTDANKEGALYKAELEVSNAGIDYSIVRPNFIFQNFINYDLAAVKGGAIYLPSGDGKTSYIDVRDVAAAVGEILTDTQKHSSKIYNLTGPEALSHDAMANIFTSVLGYKVNNLNPAEEAYKATLLGYGLPPVIVNFMAILYSFIKAGYFATVTTDFEQLMKRQPMRFKEFVEDYAPVFK
ncbi:MAG TPA: SDR family oxidoreductase [Chitinophagaceae bacterium]|nr:SDR family oxidoreductase [Chitinophagaceae bacterium]